MCNAIPMGYLLTISPNILAIENNVAVNSIQHLNFGASIFRQFSGIFPVSPPHAVQPKRICPWFWCWHALVPLQMHIDSVTYSMTVALAVCLMFFPHHRLNRHFQAYQNCTRSSCDSPEIWAYFASIAPALPSFQPIRAGNALVLFVRLLFSLLSLPLCEKKDKSQSIFSGATKSIDSKWKFVLTFAFVPVQLLYAFALAVASIPPVSSIVPFL